MNSNYSEIDFTLIECPRCNSNKYNTEYKCTNCGYEYLLTQKQVGDSINNRYSIRGIKEGGVGRVYLCYDSEFKGLTAIKTILPKYFINKERRNLFIKEAENWIRLEGHINIVSALYIEDLAFFPAIFIELISNDEYGVDLASRLNNGCKYSLQDAINFSIQFCNGMLYCSEIYSKMNKKFVHKDIKPSNILITSDNVLKITDFGLNMGTVGFKPPEWGEIELDERADIYGFGKSFLFLLENIIYEHSSEFALNFTKYTAILLKSCDEEINNRFIDFRIIKENLKILYFKMTGLDFIEMSTKSIDISKKMNKGTSLGYLGFHKEALKIFEEIFDEGKHVKVIDFQTFSTPLLDSKLWYNIGQSYLELKQYPQALKFFTSALSFEKNPLSLSRISCKVGVTYYNLNDMIHANEYIDKAIEYNPDYSGSWNYKVLILNKCNQIEDAIHLCKIALEKFPIDIGLLKTFGNLLFSKKEFELSLEYYKKAEIVNPIDRDTVFSIACLYQNKGDNKNADLYYLKLIKYFPNYWEGYYNLAHSYSDTNRGVEAKNYFDKTILLLNDSIKIENLDYNLYFRLAICLYKTYRQNEAIDILNKIPVESPYKDDAVKYIDLIANEEERYYTFMQEISNWNNELLNNNLRIAIQGYTQLIPYLTEYYRVFEISHSVKSLLFQCHGNIGIALSCLRDYESSIINLDKALQYFQNSPNSLYYKGFCLYELKQFELSIACLNQALENKFENHSVLQSNILNLLKGCYIATGDSNELENTEQKINELDKIE